MAIESPKLAKGLGPPDRDRFAQAEFRRLLVNRTLLFWAAIYVLFTIRSFGIERPYLLEQAICRLVMMPVGLALCASLFRLLMPLSALPMRQQLLRLPPLVILAALTYAAVNYVVFYVVPGLWQPRYPALSKIGLDTLDFIWMFGAWVALFYFLRSRTLARHQARERVSHGKDKHLNELWVKHREVLTRLPIPDVVWFESEGDYVRVHTEERSHLVRSTTGKMEEALNPADFLRIHRRVIVSVSRLSSIIRRTDGRVFVRLSTGVELPVGRHYFPQLKRLTLLELTENGAEA